ncbi:hypothetical protein BSKO_00093 [Bryopsis sp. KO-2023]|nr:hypothetical protein BSKO_00093 [Bryopsis sp. KO-2023]
MQLLPRSFNRWIGRLCDSNDSQASRLVACLLLVWEAIFCGLVIWKIPYTEIDWVAYMEQVEAFLQGERDYTKIEGQSGPIVYPAGFLYVFTGIHKLTGGGDIHAGQIFFYAVYLVNLSIVFEFYIRSKCVPPWALVMLTLSKRIHSIFLLRLFNDCIAMLVANVAILLLLCTRVTSSIVVFSMAVSIKMNVLLMAPPVLAIVLMSERVIAALVGVVLGVVLQIGLAMPFLMEHPGQYLSRAFEFSRVFLYKWTVNWKFLPEGVFLSKPFAISLLAAHIGGVFLLSHFEWMKTTGGCYATVARFLSKTPQPRTSNPKFVLWAVFTGNFLGILFSRSLHYQFYSWYFFSIPFLLWQTTFPTPLRIVLFLAIETSWNVFPATEWSSFMLLAAHGFMLWGALRKGAPQPFSSLGREVKLVHKRE